MKNFLRTASIMFSFLALSCCVYSKPTNKSIFQFRVYHLKDERQVSMTDNFLQHALLPALHRIGIKNIGVFKPLANDTAADKLIYVLIPFSSLDQWKKTIDLLASDEPLKKDGEEFLHADAKAPGFQRMESILLEAFDGQHGLLLPKTKDPGRVFELRSYESPTAHLLNRKIAMFNNDELEIFSRLGFDPVFYGNVISGDRMPNLMYMPVFKSVEDRNAQWKVFVADPKWKEISTGPKYENKVSVNHIDSILMHATGYSDY